MNWLLAASAVVLLGTAVVTLRAAEHTAQGATAPDAALVAKRAAAVSAGDDRAAPSGAGTPALNASSRDAVAPPPPGATKQHPPASAPEESATIADDPTTAPDPSQSADNNVSFPTDI